LTAEAHEEAALSSLLFISFESFILSIILATIILNSLRRQLGADPKELMEVAREIANGNLDIPKKAKVTGVYDSLITTVERLKDIIVGIKMGSEEVSVATEQVSKGNMDLSQRTQEQASSLEEVAASMEEMTGAVGQNASNAGRARDLASAARDQADKGSEVVNRAIASMGEINESSKRISEIIGVIDEIAFQTNLLALNAAVEAARAGDQGRGFGVVAGEVRTLAGRSAEAAKEIKALIEDSVAKVRDGTEFVGQSGEVLSDILTSVKEVSEVVNEIAAANSEQSGGIQQVNTAIMQMDEMTQQNASLVEEAAAASETMGAQAQELQASIAFFRLSQEDEEAIRRAAKTNGVATRSRRLN
ncbi:MAG: methyl-accepting chemotaxis protein, partial [Gammaproteobacteria bacterium]|nr:methyl-accepting chemotaxis protein [Gammaproteobacteria bacterium]